MEEFKLKHLSIATWVIIAVNVIVFIMVEATGSSEDVYHMIDWGASFTPYVQAGEYYRLFTSMFLHFGFRHLMVNMFVLLITGDRMESYLGRVKYLILYLGGGMCGGILSFFVEVQSNEAVVSAGASGAVFAVLGGMLVAAFLNRGTLQGVGFHKMSVKRFIFVVVLMLLNGFATSGVDGFAHLGGFAAGAVLVLIFTSFKRGESEQSEQSYIGRQIRGMDGRIYCPYCRNEVNMGMRFCGRCGKQLQR